MDLPLQSATQIELWTPAGDRRLVTIYSCMDGNDEPALNKVARLAIAGAVAPVLRDGATRSKARRVNVVGKDDKVARVVTLAEVQDGLLAAKKIELEVEDGVRPKEILCACGAVRKVPKQGALPKVCKSCAVEAKSELDRKRRAANPEKDRERKRKWRAANPEKARELARKRRAANPEKARELVRKCRAANPEKARELASKWYAANSDKDRERKRKWRAANPEKARELARKRRAANPEKAREHYLKWRAANLKKAREANREANRQWRATPEGKAARLAENQARRAMLKGAHRDGTHVHWKTRLALHDSTCVYCPPGTKHERLTLDHLQPLAKGGAHVLVNFVPACRFHNTAKCDFVIDFEAARRVDPEITARILTFVEESRRFLCDQAGHGPARQRRQGAARQGLARPGMATQAGRGKAWQGKARNAGI